MRTDVERGARSAKREARSAERGARSAKREARSAERRAQKAECEVQGAPRSALRAPRLRSGFTLLEMMLATLVSVLLMGALYVAVDAQLRHAQAGRDVIQQSTLAHSVLARMTRDIKQCVTTVVPVQPPPLFTQSANASTSPSGNSSTAGQNSGTAQTSGTNSAAASSSSTTNNTSAATTTPSSSSSATSLPLTRDTIQFQIGVKGDANSLIVYISRLPYIYEKNVLPGQVLSDLRLVNYWLATDGSTILGLMRREFKDVTSDEANGAGEGPTPGVIVASEVQSLQFRYFDGVNWFDSWDGTQPGFDGVTPVGPPAAIEITLGMAFPSSDGRPGVLPTVRYYRHVVPILTADGQAQTNTGS